LHIRIAEDLSDEDLEIVAWTKGLIADIAELDAALGACSLMSRANAAQSAAQVRREWGVGETQPVDILRILWSWECISVIRTPFGESSRASGLFARKNDSVLIVLNSGRTLGRRFFTAAHELYHVRFNEACNRRGAELADDPPT
jgi:hypothetical protein